MSHLLCKVLNLLQWEAVGERIFSKMCTWQSSTFWYMKQRFSFSVFTLVGVLLFLVLSEVWSIEKIINLKERCSEWPCFIRSLHRTKILRWPFIRSNRTYYCLYGHRPDGSTGGIAQQTLSLATLFFFVKGTYFFLKA